MALKITRNKRYVPTFDGNRDLPEEARVSFAYRAMSVEDVNTIQTKTGVNLLTQEGVEGSTFRTNWEVIRSVIEGYTWDWANVEADGVALKDPKEVLDALNLRFINLFGEVFQFLMVASLGTEEDAKNFVPGSVQRQPESTTPVADAATTTSESETAEASTPSNSEPQET